MTSGTSASGAARSRRCRRRRSRAPASSTLANHVVAPGFIDLHEHGQQEESYRMMVRDGVTSAFELEVGTGDVATWYQAREGGQIVNYGVSIGHIPARMKVLGDPGTGPAAGRHRRQRDGDRRADGGDGSDPARRARAGRGGDGLRQRLHTGRADLGDRADVPRRRARAASRRTSTCAAALAGLRETIAAAKSAGAPLHIVHVNSSAGDELDGFLAADQGGARRGTGRHDRSVSLRRRHDRDPVGALRRLGELARRSLRAAPAGVDRRAADARELRQGACRPAAP